MINIILLSNKKSSATALTSRHVVAIIVVLLLAAIGLMSFSSWVTYKVARTFNIDMPNLPITSAGQQKQVDVLAVKVRQLSGYLDNLKQLTQQVSRKTGIDPNLFRDNPILDNAAPLVVSDAIISEADKTIPTKPAY